jgi:hypothetical protein
MGEKQSEKWSEKCSDDGNAGYTGSRAQVEQASRKWLLNWGPREKLEVASEMGRAESPRKRM